MMMMEEEVLPPGFRFYPTEEELISFYLNQKLHSLNPDLDRVIPSIDFYSFEPSQLPGLAGELCNGEREQWFFFSPRQEREARGGRPTRSTGSGYWKATGSPTYIYSSENNKVIGIKKTMVFYRGKAPTGRKTKWKLNEYKAIKPHQHFYPSPTSNTIPEMQHELSLCRVYITSGCARAFDRRPPGRMLMPNLNITGAQNDLPRTDINGDQMVHENKPIFSKNNIVQNNTTTMFSMEKSSSSSAASSNSGGNNCHGILQVADKEVAETEDDHGIEITVEDVLESFSTLEHFSWL